MEAIESIKTRMSIRKFRPEPVPKDTLLEVINTARWSPSYKNSQPWKVVIVSGQRKDELSNTLVQLIERGEQPVPDIEEPLCWPSEIDIRIKEHLKRRSEHFGIDLTDPNLLKKAKIANFRFYGAPHGIFLYQDASLTRWSILDAGMFAQSIMLSAHAYGLGTVPQAFLIDYSPIIKSFLQIPETDRLVLGMSIGYPDLQDKANSFRSTRIDTEEIVKWIE